MSDSPAATGSRYGRPGRTFLIALLVLGLWLGWKLMRPFLTAIAAAGVLAVVVYPAFTRLERLFRGRRMAAAGVTVLLVVVLLIVPLLLMGLLFTKQALDLYGLLSAEAQDWTVDRVAALEEWQAIDRWLQAHAPWLDTRVLNAKGLFLKFLERVSSIGVSFGTSLAANLLVAVGTFAVMLFTLFFVLVDGAAFGRWVGSMIPLSDEDKTRLAATFIAITRSSVIGSGIVAVTQGILGGAAFAAVGLRGVLWGTVMAFMSLVPVVGTTIVWAPAGVILILQGRVGAGFFLLAWGGLVIATSDNVIRMFVVKGARRIHPLLIFFSVLGGIKLAGPIGVVFGPLLLATVQTLLDMYRGEFLVAAAPPAAPAAEEEEP